MPVALATTRCLATCHAQPPNAKLKKVSGANGCPWLSQRCSRGYFTAIQNCEDCGSNVVSLLSSLLLAMHRLARR